ncbi:hypothetical protein CQ14_21265 [Bradyrhizobium lablabi]|uniref:Uncharacterized protein n=1 Tax=Bradyrhizobium lablabi TaxID=722472 RepID=A0A0R3N8U9_9BRAD|nr:ATP-binding protein [Bradyrhizobium lablabi]KRR26208.1 hypothetical protein CQ14_21265 [Bradyrhizobium lablabi]
MLDVEFLLDPPSSFDRPLIYRYRSGYLRTPLKKVMHALAEQEHCVLVQCAAVELPSFCAGGSLFPSVALCDLPAPSNGRSNPDDILALQALSTEGAKTAILFVEEGHALLKHPEWLIAKQASLVVEEPVITAPTVAPVLEYLVRQSEFVRNRDLMNQDEFRSYFDELIAERDSMELPDFAQEFDRTVLLHVDPKTGRFLGCGAIRKQQVNPNRIVQPLRGLVERRDPLQLSDLLRGLAVRFPSGRTGREVADELAKHAQTLFKPGVDRQFRLRNRAGRRGLSALPGYDTSKTNVWLWAAIVLAFTPRLFRIELQEAGRRPVADLSLVTVDQMGREFLRRIAQEDEGDPLSGLWPELEEVILGARKEDEKEITVQGKLEQLLKLQMEPRSPNEPRWIGSLRMILADDRAAAAVRLNNSPAETAKRPELPRHCNPRTFADVIGQQATVEGLRRRLQHNDSTPLILYGPEGVGKRTLARLYAKGLLCDGVSSGNPRPCGRCESCLQFEAREVLDYIEFDAGAPHAADYVRKNLLKNLQYASFSRHRPVLVSNPDKSPRLVDMCLKTLETHSELTRFIFTVSDIRAMSDTGKSRCDVYRLSRLDNESAKNLGKRFLEPCISTDERAIDLLVAEANGVPRRLLELSAAISSSNATTIGQVRRILGLDWVADAISLCRSLLSPPKVEEGTPQLPPAWHRREAVGRVRLIFAEIHCVHENGKARRSAFLHLAGDPINELALALRDRAIETGVSFRDLWAAISQLWAADNHDFWSAWWKARALLR